MAEAFIDLLTGTLHSNYTHGSGSVSLDVVSGVMPDPADTWTIRLNNGAWYTVSGFSGSGPYTATLAALEYGTDVDCTSGQAWSAVTSKRALLALITENAGPGVAGVVSPDALCSGDGSEGSPFIYTTDNTAGIQTRVDELAADRGGAVQLSARRYNVTASDGVRISSPSIAIVAPVAGFNVEPGGLSEGENGCKIHTTTHGIRMGSSGDKLGGILLRSLYLWGPGTSGTHDGLTVDDQVDQLRVEGCNLSNFDKALNITDVMDAAHLTALSLLGNAFGIYIDTGASAWYTKILGCEISDNESGGIKDVATDTDYLRVEDCTLVRNAYVLTTNGCNIFHASDYGIFIGNTILNAGHALLANTQVVADGMIVTGDYNTIVGNNISDNQGGAALILRGNWNNAVGNFFRNNIFDVIIEGQGNIVKAPYSASVIDAGKDSKIERVANVLPADTIAAWNTFQGSISTGKTDPTGGTGACRVIPNTSNDYHSAYLDASISSAGGGLFVVIAKAAGYNYLGIGVKIGGTDTRGWVNLSDGSIGTVMSGVVIQTHPLSTSGWYVCLVFSTTAITTVELNIGNADNATMWTGDGSSGIDIFRPYGAPTLQP